MGLRAIVFDFDGLLLETETPALRSWQEIYARHGHEVPMDRWLDYIGRQGGWWDALAHLESLGVTLDRDQVWKEREARKAALIEALDLMPGARELVVAAKARGIKVAVASSASERWVCGHLDRLRYRDVWDAVVCRGEGLQAKPAPDIYLATLRALGVEAPHAVALEDSANGVLAAKAAGLWCVAVPNGVTAPLPLEQADMRVASLSDIRLEDLLALTSTA